MAQPTPPAPTQPPTQPGTNTKKLITIVAGAAIVAFALGGGVALLLKDDGKTDDKPTVAKAAASSPPATPSPSPSPSQPTLRLGDTADISSDVETSAAALAYTDEGIKGWPEALDAGRKWAVVMVKVCNKGTEAIGVSTYPWSLAYADGVRVDSAGMNAGDLPQPLYPMDAKVKGGDCVRGNIVFQVPQEGRPERVLYSPETLDEPVEWLVGKR